MLWASPPGRWLQARAELGSPDEDPERQEEEQDTDDYCLDGGQEEAEPQDKEQRCSERSSLQQEPEPKQEAHDRDGDAKGGLGLGSQGLEGAAGSAEALLSDLHAFAGSAAWDDSSGAAGGQGLHVTAL